MKPFPTKPVQTPPTSAKPTQVQPVMKTMNNAPGFRCPACDKASIQLSLDQFLDTSQVKCPVCGTAFSMNKAECAELVDMLQGLRVAQRNVALLSNRKL